ncbi:hypothetical protein HYW44_03125 [Candidatus Daviesbacteria bacterium]|nr:hypothetical protein [Candidatus Daviesbacteria bacterium]
MQTSKDRLSYGRKELLNDPVFETSLAIAPVAGRLLNVAYIPAFYLATKLNEASPSLDWHWVSAGVVVASLAIMSLTEFYAIKKRKYCNNSNTNLLNIAFESPIAGICGSKVWSFVNMLSPTNPVDLGMVSYATISGDWSMFLNFVAARNTVKTAYNSSIDLLIATGKLDPLYEKVRMGNKKTREFISKIKDYYNHDRLNRLNG